MKYLYLTFFLGISGGILSAQITINQNNLPQGGRTYLTATDTIPAINNGSPSASAQTWNFSSLSSDYQRVPTYGYTSWTPYASAFPASNIYTYGPAAMYSSLFGGAPVNSQGMNQGYMFWITDATGFWIEGFRSDSGNYANVNVHENPRELLIGIPNTYGSSFNNYARWEFPMNLNSTDLDTFYVNTVSKTLVTDAWGTLTTPTATYPDVIRVHEHLVKVDSVYAKMGSTIVYSMELTRDTLNNYMYLSDLLSYPASIVHCDVNDNILDVEFYQVMINGINSIAYNADIINVYPVPAREAINFQFTLESRSSAIMLISDAQGRIVRISEEEILEAGSHEMHIDISGLPAGIYTMQLLTDLKSAHAKFIVTD